MSGVDELTDREALEELLRRFGLGPYAGGEPSVDPPSPDEVLLVATNGGVEGYSGFFARFTFDADGKFRELGIWE